MKISFNLFLSTIFCFILVDASAAEKPADFVELLQTITTLSGTFKQTIADADGEEAADPTEGKFYLKRPGKFYWHTAPPFEQLVVGNDVGLVLYDPDLEQVTVYDREEFLRSPAAVLSGSGESIEEKYKIESKSAKGVETYVLTEKDLTSKSFDTLTFVFKKNALVSLALKDQLGQVTNIRFNDVQVNKQIDDSLFVFVPPEGADVIVNQ